MSTQPEALRLADALNGSFPEAYASSAADELRRQHEEIAELLGALKLMRDRFRDVDGTHGQWEQEATDAADAAIAKHGGNK